VKVTNTSTKMEMSYSARALAAVLGCLPSPESLCWMPLVVSLVSELAINGFFTLLDLGRWDFFSKYRLDYCSDSLGRRKYPTPSEIFHGFKIFLYSYLRIILPLHAITISLTYLGIIPPPVTDLEAALQVSDSRIALDFVLCILMADVWNYTFHRLMHVPYFFRRFHKLHHEYTYTFVWVNHAFHDAEVLLFGMSVIIPPLLLRSHVVVTWLFTSFTILHTGYQHSGYMFPFLLLTSPIFHDAHHYLIHKNFSSHTPFLDMIFGTYAPNGKAQRESYSWKRAYKPTFPRLKSFILFKTDLSK